jgi:uncharacterized repeat protein (TIGR02543 family)
MQKIFSLIVVILACTTAFAGSNDLLWDFSGGAPASSPTYSTQGNTSTGLTFNNKVQDSPSTNNALNGIKMNSSGYCYFTKPAVAGTLKLGFGPRIGSNSSSLVVSTWTGNTPAAQTAISTTATRTDYGIVTISLSASQNNIYINRADGSTETVLQYIEFRETANRSFVPFKIEFRDNPYTVLLPTSGSLPSGVSVSGTSYNGGQHGVYGGTITVPVDGPVKFTIGGCQYSGSDITIKKNGSSYATVSNKTSACGEQSGQFINDVTWMYTESQSATLTFTLANNTFVPYFFAEAVEISEVVVTYKDEAGNILGTVTKMEGDLLGEVPESITSLVSYNHSTHAFRGWFYSNGKKCSSSDMITSYTTLVAKVTPIETATMGSIQTYDFTSQTFYPEDHETITTSGGEYHDPQHGWIFGSSGSLSFQVAGNAVIIATLCEYSASGNLILKTASNQEVGRCSQPVASDGTDVTFRYTGSATTLTFTFPGNTYIHKLVVYNVNNFPEKDPNTGYYMVAAGDAGSFIIALAQANSEGNAKIFLPDGTYDLGETVLTAISGNNISIIGQSMTGVIIRNAPDYTTESIDKTATLVVNKNVTGTYLQDLTIQNALDYYHNNNGRAVCLWDKGTKTVCKNVRLLSYQDTYYSNLQGAVKYFEDCEIHGTVDFICGDGSVFFESTALITEARQTGGGGSDAITASNSASSDKGYVFDHCTIRHAAGQTGTLPVVSLGRSWNNAPKCVFLNTTIDNTNGTITLVKDASAQKDKIARWTLGAMNALPSLFGEYRSVDKSGNVVSPSSNYQQFVLGNESKSMETILSASQAATYTKSYTLGSWATEAVNSAQQVELSCTNGQWAATSATEFLVIDGGTLSIVTSLPAWKSGIIVRAANGRGGFGPAATNTQNGNPTYTVTWNANGGTCTQATSVVNQNTAIGTLPTATREGYTFDGWWTAAEGGTAVTTATVITSNVTFYAHWTSTSNPTSEDVIFHWRFDGGDAPAAGSSMTTIAGTMTAQRSDASKNFSTESAAYAASVPADLKSQGTNGIKMGANALYFTIEPISSAEGFKRGDTIFICGYLPWKISTTDAHAGDITDSVQTGTSKTDYQVGYVVLQKNASTLYLMRARGKGTGVTGIKVTRPENAPLPIYTVTFKDNFGNTLKTEEVESGSAATAPTIPTIDCYTAGDWDVPFNNVTSDLIVTVTYTVDKHTVTLHYENTQGNAAINP